MPRTRALVLCAVAIVALAVGMMLAFGWFELEPAPRPPAEATPAAAAGEPHQPMLPAVPADATEAARVTVADPELAEELARQRLYESFGVRRVGATGGGLRVIVTAGETKIVGHEAFFVPIQKTWGDEKAWLDVVRRVRPIEGVARTDVDGVAHFDGQHVHGVLAWVMHHQTMLWRASGPVLWKAVSVEIGFGPVVLRGSVHDGNGLPRAGAVISAVPVPKPGRKEQAFTTYVGVSDELGKFELTGLPHDSLIVTCLGNETFGYAEERRTIEPTRGKQLSVRFGGTPGLRWWRGRVVDENGAVVVGPNDIQFEHSDGERRVVASQSDGTFAVQLWPGVWRARVGRATKARSEIPLEVVVEARDVEGDVVLPGRQVLLRLAAGDPNLELVHALDWLALTRQTEPTDAEPAKGKSVPIQSLVGKAGSAASPSRGTPMVGGRLFRWNGADYYGWSGLPDDVYTLVTWGDYEVVGMPEGGMPIDTRLVSPTIVDVLLRRAEAK